MGIGFLALPPIVFPAQGSYELDLRPAATISAEDEVIGYGELSGSAQRTVDTSIASDSHDPTVGNAEDLATFRRYSFVEKDGMTYEITLINRVSPLEHGLYSLAAFVFLFFSLLKFFDILSKSPEETTRTE